MHEVNQVANQVAKNEYLVTRQSDEAMWKIEAVDMMGLYHKLEELVGKVEGNVENDRRSYATSDSEDYSIHLITWNEEEDEIDYDDIEF